MLAALAVLAAGPPTARAADEIDARHELRLRLDDLLGQRQAMQEKASALASQLQEARRRQTEETALLVRLRQQRGEEAARLEAIKAQAAEMQTRLTQARRVYGRRLRALYLFGADASLHLLASSQSLAEALERSRAMTAVVEADRRRLDALAAQAAALARLEDQLRRQRDEHARTCLQLEQSLERLESHQSQASALMGRLSQEQGRLAEVIEALREAESRLVRTFALDLRFDPDQAPEAVSQRRAAQPVEGVTHEAVGSRGVTFSARRGAQVRAPWDGEVAYAAEISGWGKVVVLDHGQRVHTVLAYLETLSVEPGQRVAASQVVGAVGPGGRLYLEVRKNSKPVNSLEWLRLAP